MSCAMQSTGQIQCKVYDSLLKLESKSRVGDCGFWGVRSVGAGGVSPIGAILSVLVLLRSGLRVPLP